MALSIRMFIFQRRKALIAEPDNASTVDGWLLALPNDKSD
jgi:hypothetical protein